MKLSWPAVWPGVCQTFSSQIADRDHVALVEQHIDLAGRHRDLEVLLGLDGGVGHDLVAGLQRLDAERMGGHLGLEQFLGAGEALDVVGVGVRGDDHLAGGQVEIHLPDQLDDLVDRVEVADVDEQELAAAVDEIDVDAQAPAGLVVHLDDVGEEILPRQHDRRPCKKRISSLMIETPGGDSSLYSGCLIPMSQGAPSGGSGGRSLKRPGSAVMIAPACNSAPCCPITCRQTAAC